MLLDTKSKICPKIFVFRFDVSIKDDIFCAEIIWLNLGSSALDRRGDELKVSVGYSVFPKKGEPN